jgi:GntR family transcriptional regulator
VRLRLANGAPVALQSSVLPARICPGLEHEDLTDKSLFSVLRQKYFVHPAWTEAEVEARSAAAEEAELLRLAPGDPVLVITGLTFTETFEFVESVRTVYRGNDMAIYIGRQRL